MANIGLLSAVWPSARTPMSASKRRFALRSFVATGHLVSPLVIFSMLMIDDSTSLTMLCVAWMQVPHGLHRVPRSRATPKSVGLQLPLSLLLQPADLPSAGVPPAPHCLDRTQTTHHVSRRWILGHLKVFARWRGHQVRVGLVQLCPHTAARHAATETLNVFFFSPSTTDSVQDVHSALENVNKCIPGVFSAAVRGQDLVVIMLLWMHM